MRRRQLLAALAVAAATPRLALAGEARRVPLTKAFPFLAAYYGLAPEARSRFHLGYRAVRGKQAITEFSAWVAPPAGPATPLPMDARGMVTRLPTPEQMKAGGDLVIATPDASLANELRASMASQPQLDATQIAAALAQLNADIAKFAGPLRFAAPKMTAAFFPDAGAGQALLADGHAAPLPVYASPFAGPVAYFEPARAVGARAVLLARAPSRIILGAHPKTA